MHFHPDIARVENLYRTEERGFVIEFLCKANLKNDSSKKDVYDIMLNPILAQLILDRIEYDIYNIKELNKYKQYIPINAAVMNKAIFEFYTKIESKNITTLYGHDLMMPTSKEGDVYKANIYKYLFEDGEIKNINKKYADESKASKEALSTVRLGADLSKLFTCCYVSINNESCIKYILDKLKNPGSSDKTLGNILMEINPFFGTLLATVFKNVEGDLSYLEILLVLKHFYNVDFFLNLY